MGSVLGLKAFCRDHRLDQRHGHYRWRHHSEWLNHHRL
jgi:hypothetical protein